MNVLASPGAAAAPPIPVPSIASASERIASGFPWGVVIVLAFSSTLPVTRLAAPELGKTIAGLGGITGAGQIQLVQPVMTMTWAARFLGEVIDLPTAWLACW